MTESFAPMIFWAITFAAFALTCIMAVILGYHWFRYGLNKAVAASALVIFVVVSGILLLTLFGGALAISL